MSDTTNLSAIKPCARRPDFDNILAVLRREAPSRPTLFELFLNWRLYQRVTGIKELPPKPSTPWFQLVVRGFASFGYDYATVLASDLSFPIKPSQGHGRTRSMNDSMMINDRKSFEAYPWPDPDRDDYGRLDVLQAGMPKGMKLIPNGPGGVLENTSALLGYEGMCLLLADDPELVRTVVDAVGSRMLRYYEICSSHPAVGAVVSNDDWGFNSQLMLPPGVMRELIFPWHRRIVATIHAAGKPAILHSCGNLAAVMDDIIDDLKYDAKHSFEDKIIPVEEAYEQWGRRIAILGGIDLDFVCRRPIEEIRARSLAMLERSARRGGYALGTGNSVPEYVPDESYLAMISAAVDGNSK